MGQDFAGVPASFAIGLGERTQILGVHQTVPAADSEFRFNFGFVETAGANATVTVTVYDETGSSLDSKSYSLRPYEQRQFRFPTEFPSLSTTNARIQAEITGGTGKAVCYSCHQTPVDSGKVKHAALERYGCVGCHDPHGTANRFLLARKTNDLCITCHEAQKDGKHVTSLVPRGHAVGGNLNDPRKPDRPFSCASCHNPHGSDNPRFFYFGATAMESCDLCHGDKTGRHPELKNIVARAKR